MASDVDTGTVHGPIYGTSAIAQCDGHVLELTRAQYDLALRDAASQELNDIVELLRRKNLVSGLGHLTQQQLQVGVDQSRTRLKISQQRIQTEFDQFRVRNIRILWLGENEMKRGICDLLTRFASVSDLLTRFASVSEQAFATLLRPHSFPRGDTLFDAGSRANAVYFVVEGEVGLLRYSPIRQITDPNLKPQTQNLEP